MFLKRKSDSSTLRATTRWSWRAETTLTSVLPLSPCAYTDGDSDVVFFDDVAEQAPEQMAIKHF
jgi:hypothetical protein